MTSVFFRDLHHKYPVAVKAEGMYITDEKGKSYLDMCGGAAVSCLGHQHPHVIQALHNQTGTMAFAHTGFFTNEPQEQLAAALTGKFAEADAKAYFTTGGSEANETALKLVWQYWQAHGHPEKIKIISRKNSYHGNTLGALSVSGAMSRREPVAAVLHDWPRIDPCYAYRYRREGETEADYAIRSANQLEEAILTAGPETVAAFIAEPIVGASLGAVTAATGYFTRIREICDTYDVLLIADEIMCGTGRTGTFFAHQQEGFLPDIVTLAKGLGGGYLPLAATIARQKIVEPFEQAGHGFSHGHTYVGHASSCAVGVAVLETIESEQLLGAVHRQGTYLETALTQAFTHHPNIGDIRGRGLFRALEIVSDKNSKTVPKEAPLLAKRIRENAMKQGLMCYPSGSVDNCHILLAPPFILADQHIDQMVDRLKPALEEALNA